jgi:hypothetical protein
LNSSKQYADALERKETQDMGTVAKELKEMFNMITARCGKLEIPIICTAHVYEEQIQSFKRKRVTGGSGSVYMSSVVCLLTKSVEKDKETKVKTGVNVKCDIIESRYAKPTTHSFYINFTKGMNRYYGLNKYFSWGICGIDRGKFVEMVDIFYELNFRKKADISNYNSVSTSYDELCKLISKQKVEVLAESINEMLSLGYIAVDGDKITFKDKILERFNESNVYNKIDDVVGVVNKASGQWIVKHLKRVVSARELFTDEVLNDEVMNAIDEYSRPEFEYQKDKSY